MEKGKMIEWTTMSKITITKMEITEKGGYRLEVKETGKYYISKKNDMLDAMYKDYLIGRKIEITFSSDMGTIPYRREIATN